MSATALRSICFYSDTLFAWRASPTRWLLLALTAADRTWSLAQPQFWNGYWYQ